MARSPELGEERHAQVGRAVIRYRERGEGAPIVFVGGLMTNGDLWRKVVPALSGRHRCIAPDWPLGAHADPMPPDADLSPPGLARLIAAFCDQLGLEDVTLVANDTGGALAQILVAEQPDRLARLVLTSCDAFENFFPPTFRYLQVLAHAPGAMWVAAQSLRLAPVRNLPIVFGRLSRRPLERDLADSFLEPARRSRGVRRDLAEVLRRVDSSYTLEAARELREFAGPVLVAWAEDGGIFPRDHGERLAELFPDSRFELVEDSAVYVPEDRPDRLAELIDRFVSER